LPRIDNHPLMALIQEATHNSRPASHGQRPSDHEWETVGGARPCPRGGDQSQAVYECKICPEVDYGDPPGPGFEDCFGSLDGCDGCLSTDQIWELQDALKGEPWDPLKHYQLAIEVAHHGYVKPASSST
jgi:hypothetical protein